MDAVLSLNLTETRLERRLMLRPVESSFLKLCLKLLLLGIQRICCRLCFCHGCLCCHHLRCHLCDSIRVHVAALLFVGTRRCDDTLRPQLP